MTILVLAEHDNRHLKHATLHVLAAAASISNDITVLVAGSDCRLVTEQVAACEKVSRVLLVDAPAYQHQLPENLSILISEIAKEYRYIMAAATTVGKNILPRVAALLDVAQISDITAVISEDTFKRPVYAGNAFATVKALDPIKVITVRASTFASVAETGNQAPITVMEKTIATDRAQFIRQELTVSSRPELSDAKVVVSGGRGMQNGENFKMLEQLADCLNAALGASRAAVDAGFVPNDYQVGQTGKIVAPNLYIAIGISGAIQHLAGMKSSKVIVAINKDPDAPIFQIADYGLVADLFTVVPEMIQLLQK